MSELAGSNESNFDDSGWPIVLVVLPTDGFVQATLERHCDRLCACFERGEHFAWVIDTSDTPPLSAHERRALADRLNGCMAQHPNVRCFAAIVAPGAVQRGILRAILWLMRSPLTSEVFETVDEAVVWARRSVAHCAAVERHSVRSVTQ